MNNNVIKIRPKVIFTKIENQYPTENVTFSVNIPTSQIGGMTLLESSILVSFIKLNNPMHLFEFGTYMGATTVLLASNTDHNAKIFSLDIDPKELESNITIDVSRLLSDDKINDQYLRNNFANTGAKYIKNADHYIKDKIELILQNSLIFDSKKRKFQKKFDFIFIDGGHEYHIVEKDTKNALQMIKEDGIILWHDYESKIHGDVTDFVNNLSIKNTIYHVENTMIAFMLIGKYENLMEENICIK